MSENSELLPSFDDRESQSLATRIHWFMVGSVVISVLASLFWKDLSLTAGLVIGGILSFINFYWLQSSARRFLRLATEDGAPKFPVFKYVWRFVVIGLVVILARWFEPAAVTGILLGLCSLVAALMIEAVVQLYLHFSKREEL